MSETRKLAAILAADVVGFSRLARAEEDRTLARLRTLRSDLVDPAIAVHRGKVVKRTGDGFIAEFRSVVEAVRCALEIQSGMSERNAGVPSERRIEFRCGVHLGDVVEESDGDLMGDGVNIAARLEGIATPGTICLSEDAYRQVKSRLDLAVTDLGPQRLKNISEPLRVYGLSIGKSAVPISAPPRARGPGLLRRRILIAAALALLAAAAGSGWLVFQHQRVDAVAQMPNAAARLSIVVLPFANLSGDPAQDYFAQGITEALTTALARVRGSFVIAPTTAMTYKGKSVDVKQLERTLGVRYVLEGAVQRDGREVRVSAQLIGTEKGDQLWAESFDADMSSLFKIQDDIVTRLSRALQIELVQAESQRSLTAQNPDAIDLAMRGWSTMYRTPSRENDAAARSLFKQALTADPTYADAMVGLAYADMRDYINVWTEPGVDKAARAMAEADRALALDPGYAYPYYVKADLMAHHMRPNDQQLGERALAGVQTALRLNPSFAPGYYVMGVIEEMLGRYDRSIAHIEQAMRLSPGDYLMGPWLMHIGRNHFGLHQYDAAIADELRSIDTGYPSYQPRLALAAAYAAHGDEDKAKRAMAEMLRINPALSVARLQEQLPGIINWPPGMLEAARKAGLPEE